MRTLEQHIPEVKEIHRVVWSMAPVLVPLFVYHVYLLVGAIVRGTHDPIELVWPLDTVEKEV